MGLKDKDVKIPRVTFSVIHFIEGDVSRKILVSHNGHLNWYQSNGVLIDIDLNNLSGHPDIDDYKITYYLDGKEIK